jgi:hypothetical protein
VFGLRFTRLGQRDADRLDVVFQTCDVRHLDFRGPRGSGVQNQLESGVARPVLNDLQFGPHLRHDQRAFAQIALQREQRRSDFEEAANRPSVE